MAPRTFSVLRGICKEMDAGPLLIGIAAAATVIVEEDEQNDVPPSKRRKYWTRPWLKARSDTSQCNTMVKLYKEFLVYDDIEEFQATLRMPPDVFNQLLEIVRPYITKKHTNMRSPISAEERLTITLRYLALGDCYRTLHQEFLVGYSTISQIVYDTCYGLFKALQPQYLNIPRTKEDWLRISDEFQAVWNMPHCLGSVDGKHIRVRRPPATGSEYYNYKDFYSMVLMAVVDAEYNFVFVDIGAMGQASDGGVWRKTSLYECMQDTSNPLAIPEAAEIDGILDPVPYFFVGDDAFPMSTAMMKPYPQTGLTRKQRVFNYRLSRARRTVENTFGILASKFQIFQQPIRMDSQGVERVVCAAVVLHNFLRKHCGKHYMAANAVDREDSNHETVPGAWRQHGPNLPGLAPLSGRNTYIMAKRTRDKLADYFISKQGEVPWQYERAHVV